MQNKTQQSPSFIYINCTTWKVWKSGNIRLKYKLIVLHPSVQSALWAYKGWYTPLRHLFKCYKDHTLKDLTATQQDTKSPNVYTLTWWKFNNQDSDFNPKYKIYQDGHHIRGENEIKCKNYNQSTCTARDVVIVQCGIIDVCVEMNIDTRESISRYKKYSNKICITLARNDGACEEDQTLSKVSNTLNKNFGKEKIILITIATISILSISIAVATMYCFRKNPEKIFRPRLTCMLLRAWKIKIMMTSSNRQSISSTKRYHFVKKRNHLVYNKL